jgi:hypothetical protein
MSSNAPTATRTIPITRPGADEKGPGMIQASWLARHRAEVAAAGAALAATAVGTQAKKIQASAGEHPRATMAIGGLAGAASGAALGAGSGAAVGALVIEAVGRVSDAADTVAGLARELAQNRTVTVAGGALTGTALGDALGYLLQRRARPQAAEGAGSPASDGDQIETDAASHLPGRSPPRRTGALGVSLAKGPNTAFCHQVQS